MRFFLCLTFLCLAIPTLAQEDPEIFHLRIENLRCVRYFYMDDFNNLRTQYFADGARTKLVNEMASIKLPAETFQFGVAPIRTSGMSKIGVAGPTRINFAMARFLKEGIFHSDQFWFFITYTFDLTDGITTHKMQMTYRGNTAWGIGYAFVDANAVAYDQTLAFPRGHTIYEVFFDAAGTDQQFYSGNIDLIPLTAIVRSRGNFRTLGTERARRAVRNKS